MNIVAYIIAVGVLIVTIIVTIVRAYKTVYSKKSSSSVGEITNSDIPLNDIAMYDQFLKLTNLNEVDIP